MAMKDDLLRSAMEVAKLKKIPLSRLGRMIVSDNNFFTRLQNGGDCTTQTYERAMRELSRLRAAAEQAAADNGGAGKRRRS
tara:strand:+ start:446 stop:688 length:243 start_codon:yes stop_codon:yes gene_type:complete